MSEGQNVKPGNLARSRIGFTVGSAERATPQTAGFNPIPYGMNLGSQNPGYEVPRPTLISGDRGGVTEHQREASKPLISHGILGTSKVTTH